MSKDDRDGRKGGAHKSWNNCRHCAYCRTGWYRAIDVRKERRAGKREGLDDPILRFYERRPN